MLLEIDLCLKGVDAMASLEELEVGETNYFWLARC